uniref:Cell migration inducing hyaluronidase 1 n=1 Tax=Oryzias sinensis TaxID=183150 RepID=A0A8C7X3D3_9TELE
MGGYFALNRVLWGPSSGTLSNRNISCVSSVAVALSVCPDKEPGLQPWMPGHSEKHHVTIGYGQKVLLMASATVHSIQILNGGKLVVADSNRPILLRTRSILIGKDGELHIGSWDCPYRGNVTISLFGRLDSGEEEHSYFGRKFIGVGTGGTLEIHGRPKLAWTFLNATLRPWGGHHRSFLLQRSWGSRGIMALVIDPDGRGVFDTYRSKNESRRLAEFVGRVEAGLILAMLVNDEASENLEESAREGLSELGSRHVQSLGFSLRQVERGFRAVHLSGVELQHMGQQSMGHYPVHFHMNGDVDERGGYHPPTSVSQLSIHHSFSRCITIHGSNGLQVKDVVGYDTLGHCFFTEDGPEERNTFQHCLGLLVRAGTLLPSDRDGRMCRDITEGAFPGYVANPRQDCSASSTFWIANPNNNLIDCAAAGSQEAGFWFIFHHVPTGPSEGLYPPGQSEHTPMGRFINNRAHSNYRAGMILDHGVKTTPANSRDKRPPLSLTGARYGPHQDADPSKPRVPALIHHFIAYKNQDHGAWLRGGDVWLDDCQFADNGIGLTLASGGTFPDDDGSHQLVQNSLFVGESGNRGTRDSDNGAWGPGGVDHSSRTLPRGVDFPIRGMQIYDGPINVHNCTFRNYVALDGRHTSAFGFRLNNSWQSCPNNNVSSISFDHVTMTSRVFFGEPGPWFSEMHMDGDKTTIFHDVDGSVSEYPGAFLVKEDNWLLRHPDCVDVPDWRAAICSGRYAQVYIQIRNPAHLNMLMVRNEYPDRLLTLEGALGKKKHYQQFQPVVSLAKGYTVHWDQVAPAEVTVWLINFNKLVTERMSTSHKYKAKSNPEMLFHFQNVAAFFDSKLKRKSKEGIAFVLDSTGNTNSYDGFSDRSSISSFSDHRSFVLR